MCGNGIEKSRVHGRPYAIPQEAGFCSCDYFPFVGTADDPPIVLTFADLYNTFVARRCEYECVMSTELTSNKIRKR